MGEIKMVDLKRNKTHLENKICSEFAMLKNSHVFLVMILLISLIVRLWGIWHGLPYEYDLDEHKFISTSLRFGTGDLNPHYFVYPTLFFYALFALGLKVVEIPTIEGHRIGGESTAKSLPTGFLFL